jgi:hypothetical protein
MPHAPDEVNIIKLQSLTDKEWEDLHARLLLFARKWIGRRQFRVTPNPHDITHTAIEKTLSGSRPWNSAEFSIFEHLCGVIRSEISNLVTSHDNKFTSSLNYHPVDSAEMAREDEPSVEDVCIEKDMIDKFLACLSRDSQRLREYARLRLVEGERRAKACAARLNVSVSEVYKLSRLLKQRATEFGASRQAGAPPSRTPPARGSWTNGGAQDREAESRRNPGPLSAAVSWTRGGKRLGSAIGGAAAPASGALPLKCDGGCNDNK